MQVISNVRRFIRQGDLVPRGGRVLAALSGGSDSVALVYLLRELHQMGELQLVGVAHLNHQLRETASRDENFSRGIAETLALPIVVERSDVRDRASRERRSIEDAAHAARYEFFERARVAAGADLVALGHTRDDQAETFLLRLVRGAGPRGLSAMHPRHGSIVRPLLGCSREELRDYLRERGLQFVDDESNEDVGIPRNRIRAELIPMLQSRFNPRIVDVLADEAVLSREVADWMDRAVDEVYRGAVHNWRIAISSLRAAPRAVARAVVRRAMSEAAQGRPVAFAHVEAVLGLAFGDRDGVLHMPGQQVERLGSSLVLKEGSARGSGRRTGPAVNLFHYSLSIPGEILLQEAGCVLSAEPVGERPPSATVGNAEAVCVRRDLIRGPLGVRNRRPGDRFHPIGLGGQKKLQDFFVDKKVARARRDDVPLVVDQSDRIVWVAGFGIDEAFRVTDAQQGMLLLKIRQV